MATFKSALGFLARHNKTILCQGHKYLSTTSPSLASYWNKDWKPDISIPRTPEERAAAAKKYGLRPEDYNSLEDTAIGDYPDLPVVSRNFKDPYEDYDMPGDMRNYREPIHHLNEIVGYEALDKRSKGKYTQEQLAFFAVVTFFSFLGLFLVGERFKVFQPQMPKQYPFNNLYLEKGGNPALEKEVKHYTFEKVE